MFSHMCCFPLELVLRGHCSTVTSCFVCLHICFMCVWMCVCVSSICPNFVTFKYYTTYFLMLSLWQGSADVVTVLWPTCGTSRWLQTLYLCHLDSYTATVCHWSSVPSVIARPVVYIVSDSLCLRKHVVMVQLPTITRYLVARFPHWPQGSSPVPCLRCSHCPVVTVSET